MKSCFLSLLLVALVGHSTAFSPQPLSKTATSTQLYGLFDFLNPQSAKPKAADGKMDKGVFGGKGARITVREDEDNA